MKMFGSPEQLMAGFGNGELYSGERWIEWAQNARLNK
jgi:hypothetical protein